MLLNVQHGDKWRIVYDKTTSQLKLENISKAKHILVGTFVNDWRFNGYNGVDHNTRTLDIFLAEMDEDCKETFGGTSIDNLMNHGYESRMCKMPSDKRKMRLRKSMWEIEKKNHTNEAVESINLVHGDRVRVFYHDKTKNLKRVNVVTQESGDRYWSGW